MLLLFFRGASVPANTYVPDYLIRARRQGRR